MTDTPSPGHVASTTTAPPVPQSLADTGIGTDQIEQLLHALARGHAALLPDLLAELGRPCQRAAPAIEQGLDRHHVGVGNHGGLAQGRRLEAAQSR